jgi:hypothetical protein
MITCFFPVAAVVSLMLSMDRLSDIQPRIIWPSSGQARSYRRGLSTRAALDRYIDR